MLKAGLPRFEGTTPSGVGANQHPSPKRAASPRFPRPYRRSPATSRPLRPTPGLTGPAPAARALENLCWCQRSDYWSLLSAGAGVERKVSERFGPLPNTAPKKHRSTGRYRLPGGGKWGHNRLQAGSPQAVYIQQSKNEFLTCGTWAHTAMTKGGPISNDHSRTKSTGGSKSLCAQRFVQRRRCPARHQRRGRWRISAGARGASNGAP